MVGHVAEVSFVQAYATCSLCALQMYKHPLHACSISEAHPLMATAVLQLHRKGSLQSFSSITRNGKIVSNETSGSEMREF